MPPVLCMRFVMRVSPLLALVSRSDQRIALESTVITWLTGLN